MIVTVFRSRLNSDVGEEYMEMAMRMSELAQTMPGYISHKSFLADDGEHGRPERMAQKCRARCGNADGARDVLRRVQDPGLRSHQAE
ncbi:MAG: hypothetical protein CXT64_03825 [Methanobacteriota archaeon]|nr:MAG: hypothetical protein CXT64_03825 [Euryarchaeota archaeon]